MGGWCHAELAWNVLLLAYAGHHESILPSTHPSTLLSLARQRKDVEGRAVQEEHAARRAADDGLDREIEGLRKENERQQTQIDELRKQNPEVQLRETEMMGHIKELRLLMLGGHWSSCRQTRAAARRGESSSCKECGD